MLQKEIYSPQSLLQAGGLETFVILGYFQLARILLCAAAEVLDGWPLDILLAVVVLGRLGC